MVSLKSFLRQFRHIETNCAILLSTVFPLDIISEKPNYEVGSAAKLSFAKPNAAKNSVAAVWKLNNDDDEDDLINADDLLDEDDKVEPDPTQLKGICYSS